MKFGLSLLATAILAATAQAGENPDCKLVAGYEGYGNCKTVYFVNGEGSDALWCVSRSDCEKVFPQYTPSPTPVPTNAPVNAPVAISSIEEAVVSSSTMARASKAAYLAAAVAALW